MNPIVTVYAICKNEAQFVKQWLDCVTAADYVVVLDTGSTDDTISLLQSYAKELHYDHLIVDTKVIDPWRFDVARNEALYRCPEETTIYVSIDLDELFEPGWVDALKSNWTENTRRVSYLYTWSHLSDGSDGRVFNYNKIHGKGWHWKYPVHEILVDDQTEDNTYPSSQALYLLDKIHLHHYPDKHKSRANYLPLLELRKKEGIANKDHRDYYGRIYLAHEYYYRAKYKNAIQELQDVLTEFESSSLDTASCYLFMGDSFNALGDFVNAKLSYLKAMLIEPTYREPYLNLAQVCLDNHEYQEAIFYTNQGLEKSYRHYTWLERDNSWSYQPFDILTMSCYQLGRKLESLAYAVKAASCDKNNERLQNNIQRILNTMEDKDFCLSLPIIRRKE